MAIEFHRKIKTEFAKLIFQITTINVPLQVLESSRKLEPHSLFADLVSLYYERKSTDAVLISSSGTEFHVHKFMLSLRSQFFANEFEKSNKLELEISGEIIEEVIRYCYLDEVQNLKNLAIDLVKAGHDLELEGLRTMCLKFLEQNLNEANLIECFALDVRKYKCQTLRSACVNYFKSHSSVLMESETIRDQIQQLPEPIQRLATVRSKDAI